MFLEFECNLILYQAIGVMTSAVPSCWLVVMRLLRAWKTHDSQPLFQIVAPPPPRFALSMIIAPWRHLVVIAENLENWKLICR